MSIENGRKKFPIYFLISCLQVLHGQRLSPEWCIKIRGLHYNLHLSLRVQENREMDTSFKYHNVVLHFTQVLCVPSAQQPPQLNDCQIIDLCIIGSMVLPFPKDQIVGLLKYVAILYRHLSFSNIYLSFSYTFFPTPLQLISFLALNNIRFSGYCTAYKNVLYIASHTKEDMMITPKF